MLLLQHGRIASAIIRKHVQQVERVLIARTDGIAFYDDLALGTRESAAAVISTMLGLDKGATQMFELGSLRESIVRGRDGTLVVQPLDSLHVIAVLLNGDLAIDRLHEALEQLRRFISEPHDDAVRDRMRREEGLRRAHTPVDLPDEAPEADDRPPVPAAANSVAVSPAEPDRAQAARGRQHAGLTWRDRWKIGAGTGL